MAQFFDFIDDTLTPAIYEELPRLFPEMSFTKMPGGWKSPKKLDGTASSSGRTDKTVITKKVPFMAKEQGGDSIPLIKLYMNLNGMKSYMEAVKDISRQLDKQLPPMENSADYEAYMEKVEKVEHLAIRMQHDLKTEEGAKVAEYLKNVRGYEEKFIEWAGIGFVSQKTADELRTLFTYTGKDGKQHTINQNIGRTHQMAIPFRSEGKIKGFVFRCIDESQLTTGDGHRVGKYLDAFISGTATKKYNLFGLSAMRLSTNRDMIFVEGELDALRAEFSGLENVVALSGSDISLETLEASKKKGARRVTILLDRDDTESGRRNNREKMKRAVGIIRTAGMEAFVASFGDGEGKMDVDTFLKSHTPEELRDVVNGAQYGAIAIYEKILHDAIDRGEATPKNLDEMKAQVFEMANDVNLCSGMERDLVIGRLSEDFSAVAGITITKETMMQECEDAVKGIRTIQQAREYSRAFTEASRMASEGDVAGAMSLIQKTAKEAGRANMETDFARDMALPTDESIMEDFAAAPTGIETGYIFGQGDDVQPFTLPAGALTYICGPTSHGKSRFLENLAIDLATGTGEDGDVLYYTYEEDARNVKMQLLNVFANTYLARNNIKTIKTYYKSGERYFVEHSFEAFKRKEMEFFALLKSGRLRVFNKKMDSTRLTEHIRYFNRNTRVKAVFIDYVQLIHKSGSRLQRKDELKEICEDLMEVAVETGLPIVLAAQLNRSTKSPLEMTVQNIAEASDIEQSANVVMLIWNSVVKPLPDSTAYYTGKDTKKPTEEAKRLESMGFNIGQPGKMYAILSKNRGGERNIDTVLDFNGNTGKISSNTPRKQPRESSLLFTEGNGPAGF